MDELLDKLPEEAIKKKEENKRYFAKLRKRPPKNLDLVMQQLHQDEFERTDCLDCANCCKTTSPIFTDRDIRRISKFLKLKESDFVGRYLRRDEDDFMVLKEAPCAFLGADNECFIYEARPRACSEYPHTDRKKFIQITQLTIKNTEICPATFRIVEELKKRLPA